MKHKDTSYLNKLKEALKDCEAEKRNEAFCKFFDKMKRKYAVHDTEIFMLKEAFDAGIEYEETK